MSVPAVCSLITKRCLSVGFSYVRTKRKVTFLSVVSFLICDNEGLLLCVLYRELLILGLPVWKKPRA